MSYVQLTREERYVIAHLKVFKLSLREIARRLGRHHSTISRELKRNGPAFAHWVGIPPLSRTHLMMPNWQLEVFDGNEAKKEVYGRVQARGSEAHAAAWTIGGGGCA